MSEMLSHQKAALRNSAREQLCSLTPPQRESAGQAICARLTALPAWQTTTMILLFVPRHDEPDIWPLAMEARQAGKRIALPRFVAASGSYEAAEISDPAADMVPGKFGILEPRADCKVADLKRLDLVLVPGLAFDRHGYRLGRGKGFYDRLLAAVSGRTCGVAFDAQMISAIPVEPHDIRLNCILTPSLWLEF
jgi:5-formyltetrahydrofolate cyclo-ligase